MKVKILCTALFFSCFFINSQTSINNSGIAIQGIARDNNDTAKTNANIALTFELYYLDDNDQPVGIPFPVTANLTTDAFGVFSYVLEIDPNKNAIMANRQVRLKISEGGTIISDEPLQHVPYAIAANNGVPTGSIMPYLGSDAPPGWVLCDGTALPEDGTAETLRDLIGDITPNLQGMFLRGQGTSPVNGQAGPALMATQGDTAKEHDHTVGSLATESKGNHHHAPYGDTPGTTNPPTSIFNRVLTIGGNGTSPGGTDGNGSSQEPNLLGSMPMTTTGAHIHQITGSTAPAGVGNLETRPVSYGVNYIIKL